MTPKRDGAQAGEQEVARHYAHGNLEAAIDAALAAAGKDPARLAPEDLAPVDEFHIGGRMATAELAAQLGLAPGLHVLDIGSGLGGTARYLAEAHGCVVTGIDLTADYVRVATALAARVGLSDRSPTTTAARSRCPSRPRASTPRPCSMSA